MFSETKLLNFFIEYVNYASFIGYLISCIAYKNYKALLPVGYLLLLTCISSPIGEFIGNSFTLYHFFNPVQFLLFCWFFFINFENTNVKRAIPYIAAIAIVFAIVNTVFLQSIKSNPSNFIIAETLSLIIFAIMLFIEKLDAPSNVNLFKDPIFITTAAILLFNIFSFVAFLSLDYFMKHNLNSFSSIFRLLYFANFLFYGLLIVANLFSVKKRRHYFF